MLATQNKRIVYIRVALSCKRLVSRFSTSSFQKHVPIQYHSDQVFIRHQGSESSPVTTQKCQANVRLPITIVLFRRTGVFFKLLFWNVFFTPATRILNENPV